MPTTTEQLTERQITDLVSVFYERARAHPRLGPLFNAAVTDWDDHLRVIRDFWSHVLLGTDRYRRHAYPAHVHLPIQREHFDQWLELFRASAQETLPPDAAQRAVARAELMTESFRRGLFPFDPVQKSVPPL
jgi:hemoglobin